jgi:hypothetical protein
LAGNTVGVLHGESHLVFRVRFDAGHGTAAPAGMEVLVTTGT